MLDQVEYQKLIQVDKQIAGFMPAFLFMKKIIIFLFLFLIPLNIFSKTIAVSIYPIFNILKNITPENYKILYIIPPNANPHNFEPTPKTVISIKKADVFIGIEKDFDGWIEKFLDKNSKKLYLINKKINPHIWLSPVIMSSKIQLITNYLCSLDKGNCNNMKIKTKTYLSKLSAEYKRLKQKISKLKSRNFIQYHPAWIYFAKDFNLNIVGTITREHGVNISLRHYISLIKIGKKKKVKFIVTGFKTNANILYRLSKEISAKVIYLNLFGSNRQSYLQLINYNVNKILRALN